MTTKQKVIDSIGVIVGIIMMLGIGWIFLVITQ